MEEVNANDYSKWNIVTGSPFDKVNEIHYRLHIIPVYKYYTQETIEVIKREIDHEINTREGA